MIKVNIFGDIFNSSGYAIHTREFSNALNKIKDIEVSLNTNLMQNWIRFVNDEELKMIKRNSDDSDINLLIGLPPQWQYYLCEDKPTIGFFVWEGDKVPISFIEIFKNKNLKQIWMPSTHVKDAILNTTKDKEIIDKIKIVSHGVNKNLFYKKLNKEKNNKFTFLIDKGYRNEFDRGGIQFLVRSFLEEFSSKDNVELLIKINPVYGVNQIQNLIGKYSKKIDENKKYAYIKINEEMLPYEKLVEIYNSGDVFCITSMAEAFHLGGLQAISCGLPVMYTNFGGQTDYLNNDIGWELKKNKPIKVDWDVLYEEISWKVPDIKEIREKLRYIYEHQTEVETKSKKALIQSNNWTWNLSADKAYKYIKELI